MAYDNDPFGNRLYGGRAATTGQWGGFGPSPTGGTPWNGQDYDINGRPIWTPPSVNSAGRAQNMLPGTSIPDPRVDSTGLAGGRTNPRGDVNSYAPPSVTPAATSPPASGTPPPASNTPGFVPPQPYANNAPTSADVQGNPTKYVGTSFDPARMVFQPIPPAGSGTGPAGVPPDQQTFKPSAGGPTGRPSNFSLATNNPNVWLDPNAGNTWITPGYGAVDNQATFGVDPGNPNSPYRLPSGSYMPNRQTGTLSLIQALNGQ